ncbi:hypothetical protein ACWEOR_13810 [Micromonospora chalcea]|uniref:hypothetical protein n=1 Tax=Micromonospora sp. D75 TaxID=2824885 RepID=UPI001B38A27C|nr:hypothetical protein [Micromonospora sp. D75]MBQ1068665.1 hypothetical protein [Micromonospora sp. D75]
MTESNGSGVVITARKQEDWRPWFGDKSQFERLTQVCEAVFESRRERYISAANSLPDTYEKQTALKRAEDARVTMTIHDGTRNISGAIAKVIPSIDFDHLRSIIIKGELPSYPRFGSAKLEVWFNRALGVQTTVSSDDEGWAIEAFARIGEELKRRRPWWASMKTPILTTYMGFLTTTLVGVFALLAIVATNLKLDAWAWWLALGAMSVVQIATSVLVGRLPVFEIHAEGGKPKRLSLLLTLAWTIPSSTLLAILVNLLTD